MKKTFTNTLKYFFNALFLVTLCLCNTTNVFACNTTSDDSLPDHEVVDVEYIYFKLVDCLEKCLIYGHIRRFAN